VWGRRIVSAAVAALIASTVVAMPTSAEPVADAWAGEQAFAVWLIDPALGEAHLRIERKGEVSEVTWTASGDPVLEQGVANYGSSFDGGAMVSREADLEANVLGNRFDPNAVRFMAELSLRSGFGIWAEAERRSGV
jgi:hypothetical protein